VKKAARLRGNAGVKKRPKGQVNEKGRHPTNSHPCEGASPNKPLISGGEGVRKKDHQRAREDVQREKGANHSAAEKDS